MMKQNLEEEETVGDVAVEEVYSQERTKGQMSEASGPEKLESQRPQSLCKLVLGTDGRLKYTNKEHKEIVVKLCKCFPWSESFKYISLRNDKDEEVHLVEDLDSLSHSSRAALLAALFEVGFCFEVTQIFKVEEDFELRQWQVDTVQGPRTFQTKLMDWPREIPNGGLLIQDVAGDIYYVPKVEALPEPGKTILWAFLD